MIIVERDDVARRIRIESCRRSCRRRAGRNEEKLRRHQDRLEHQAQRLGVRLPLVAGQREHARATRRSPLPMAAGGRRGGRATGRSSARPTGDRPRRPDRPPNRRCCTAVGGAPGGAMTRSSTSLATARYCSIRSGERELVYPAPNTSSGKSCAICGSTPNRSCSVLPYSTLLKRRMTNRPGILGAQTLHPRNPVDDRLAFLLARLLLRLFRRHVVRLDLRGRPLPQRSERRRSGVLQRVLEGHPTLLLFSAMAACAVGRDERGNLSRYTSSWPRNAPRPIRRRHRLAPPAPRMRHNATPQMNGTNSDVKNRVIGNGLSPN